MSHFRERQERRAKALHYKIISSSRLLLNDEEGADGQGADAGAVEAEDGGARVGDQRFAEKVEAGVDEDRSGSGLAKFVEQTPEERVELFFDGVDADSGAVEGELFESSDGIFQVAEGGHETAIGTAIEIFVSAFGRNRKREGMKLLAVLDELVDVVEHVFVEG